MTDINDRLLLRAVPFDQFIGNTPTMWGPLATRTFPWYPDETEFQIGSELNLWFSDKGFISASGDSPSNTPMAPVLNPAINYTARLFSGFEPDGQGRATLGDIVFQNDDMGVDNLTSFFWDGREVELLAGQLGDTLASFTTVFKGTVSSIRWNDSQISLTLRDTGARFDVPLDRGVYAGTGGGEGDSGLTDTLRPYCAGQVRNITPVLVENSTLLYQVHDGQIQAINDVRDRGISLTPATTADYGTLAALLAATSGSSGDDIEPGEFATCIAEGYFRLGVEADGLVTADVQGDKSGGTYVSKTADIIERIVKTRMGLTLNLAASDINSTAFSNLNTAQPAVIGYFVGTEEKPVKVILNEIMTSIGGFWYFNRDGEMIVDRLISPASSTLTIESSRVSSIRREPYPPATYKRRLGYKKVWTVQSEENLAAGVSAANKQLFSNEWRFSEFENDEVKVRHILARDVTTFSLFDSSTDADTEVNRLQILYGVRRDIYRVTVQDIFNQVFAGDTITLKYPRFELSGGKDFVIIGMTERQDSTILELWG